MQTIGIMCSDSSDPYLAEAIYYLERELRSHDYDSILCCTGYDLDVYREVEEEDVALDEFSDEIDQWIIDQLKSIGCDTAKSVLELSVDELAKRTDLEVETIEEVVRILKAEFE